MPTYKCKVSIRETLGIKLIRHNITFFTSNLISRNSDFRCSRLSIFISLSTHAGIQLFQGQIIELLRTQHLSTLKFFYHNWSFSEVILFFSFSVLRNLRLRNRNILRFTHPWPFRGLKIQIIARQKTLEI